jgi:hypothetical protein
VKKRILNLGVPAAHDSITVLRDLIDPNCVSDYDAFVFDPHSLNSVDQSNYFRRQREIRDLVVGKGGVVICLLRQHRPLAVPGVNASSYDILQLALPNALQYILGALREGWGSRVTVISAAKGASTGYYRVLNGVVRFAAYLEMTSQEVESYSGVVFAVDSISHTVGAEFSAGAGRVCFVPVPHEATGDRVGSAIVRVVEAHYGGPSDIEAPAWLPEVNVPGSTAYDGRISELERSRAEIETEIEEHLAKRAQLLRYRELLFGYGKSVLEPVVRSAFRLLGFGVPEPDEYKGEWDAELHDAQSPEPAICEVEGSDGVVDVDKFRQLLDYINSEAIEGRDHKGILIGNGYRLTAPGAQERRSQFSNHAQNGAKRNGFCLLPASELFKAVCAVLEAHYDEGLKIQIRSSILATVGVWSFAREEAEPARAAEVSAAPSADIAGSTATASGGSSGATIS